MRLEEIFLGEGAKINMAESDIDSEVNNYNKTIYNLQLTGNAKVNTIQRTVIISVMCMPFSGLKYNRILIDDRI